MNCLRKQFAFVTITNEWYFSPSRLFLMLSQSFVCLSLLFSIVTLMVTTRIPIGYGARTDCSNKRSFLLVNVSFFR